MSYPKQIKVRRKIDALTGIKSSLDKIRSVIAFVYLLYVANERQSFVRYSVASGRSNISIEPKLLESIEKLIGQEGLEEIINKNPLITNQYEPLYVGVTLLMKMGYLKMEGKQNTAERTGGVRFPKQLYFANNTLILDLILQGFPEDVRYASLYEWLQNKKATSSDFEDRVCMFLSTCTVFTQFKLRDDFDNELFFQTEGIYDALREDNNDVVYSDSHEFVGPTRIYNNVLREGLEPWIEINKSILSFSGKSNPDADSMGAMISTTLDIHNVNNDTLVLDDNIEDVNTANESNSTQISSLYSPFITAIKSKPFLLLAGISGTGKSRIVREFAFKSCPEYLQDKDGTTPGNYCMIEVKPNWHDSTELLGYYSNMNKSYLFKKFVKFLVKAKMNPEVPFFVCLDEMNLAPVEHYFAEILSIMETRKHPKKEETGEVNKEVIKTGVIVESQYFKGVSWIDKDGMNHQMVDMSDKDWYEYFIDASTMSEGEKEQIQKYQYSRTLQTEGLTLPDNIIIIGTVNMDDTTHQFSRKVIDRAMTIEMNGGKLSNMFGGSKNLEYLPKKEQEEWQKSFRQRYVNADEVLEAHPNETEAIMEKVPAKLANINKALKGTPYEVSYRVLNELTIMVGVLIDIKKSAGEEVDIDEVINQALDRILLMKILPRIEGDSDMFNLSREFKQENHVEYSNRLEWMYELAPEINVEEKEGVDHRQTAREKIKEMKDRLDNQEFTRFWP